MPEPAVYMTLWCKRNDQSFEAQITIGLPKRTDEDEWECEWSLGRLLDHKGVPLRSVNSMLAMLTSINFIATFLKGRAYRGDLFFLDKEHTEPIEDISQLFIWLPSH